MAKKIKLEEPDLFVINSKPTKKEMKELAEFIKEHKRKEALKKAKHKKTA